MFKFLVKIVLGTIGVIATLFFLFVALTIFVMQTGADATGTGHAIGFAIGQGLVYVVVLGVPALIVFFIARYFWRSHRRSKAAIAAPTAPITYNDPAVR